MCNVNLSNVELLGRCGVIILKLWLKVQITILLFVFIILVMAID